MISPIVLYLLLITENLPLQQDRAESPGCDDCDKCDNGNSVSKTERTRLEIDSNIDPKLNIP